VCPKNRGKNWTRHPELAPDPELAKPLLVPLLEMSNRRFREVFGGSAAAWRGKKPLQRNAVIALGHFREAGAVPKLRDILLSDPRRELREAAAWALGRIGGGEALAALHQAHSVETDPEVADAIERAVKAVQERDETLQ
jgi:epoxyqueuosine reductase